MYYKKENEKVAMMPMGNVVTPIRISLAEHPQIRHARRTLTIILSIFLVRRSLFSIDWKEIFVWFQGLVIGSLCLLILGSIIGSEQVHIRAGRTIFEMIPSICYYGFGIFVAHRYSATGLRVVCIDHFLFRNEISTRFSLPGWLSLPCHCRRSHLCYSYLWLSSEQVFFNQWWRIWKVVIMHLHGSLDYR